MTDHQEPPDPFEPIDPFDELSDLSGAEPLPPLEDPATPPAQPPRSPLLTGLIVALLLVVISIAFFQFLRSDDGETSATDTTAPPATATTVAPGSAAPTTTVASESAPDGTTDGTTASTVVATFEPYVAAGEAVAFDQLTLQADGIGPIEFGSPADEAVGRLIASLGDPDSDSGPVVSTGAFGTCEGETERVVLWGPFAAIVIVDPDGTETFAGYRIDLSLGGVDSDAADLGTLSGLKVGHSVLQLEQTYEGFDLSYEIVSLVDYRTAALRETNAFQLRSANSGAQLLWGPVTSEESSGIVVGIYAPDACGRF